MGIQRRCFNIYLWVFLILGLACSCQSPEAKLKKAQTMLRIHLEAQTVIPNQTSEVEVLRAAPMKLYVEARPFLTEYAVKDAKVIDAMGGFALQIEFDHSGRMLLEQYTAGNNARRLAIFAHFADPTQEDVEIDRWLAAPRISHSITNGTLVFTPDASRKETEQIAQGLRNVAKKLGTAKESGGW